MSDDAGKTPQPAAGATPQPAAGKTPQQHGDAGRPQQPAAKETPQPAAGATPQQHGDAAGATPVRRAWQREPTSSLNPLQWRRLLIVAMLLVILIAITEQFARIPTTELSSSATWSQALAFAVPVLMAALGGVFSERAGVVNIGLEGLLILGTWFGAWGALMFGPWWGILIGVGGGALGGLLHAIATVGFGVDHIISGVAINLMAPGVTRFLSDKVFSPLPGGGITQSPSVKDVGSFSLPFLAGGAGTPDFLGWIERGGRSTEELRTLRNELRSAGAANPEPPDWFFVSDIAGVLRGFIHDISWFTLIAYALVPISVWLLWKTSFGLRLRSCGEHPVAADSLGVNVYLYKYYGVVISGALAGYGGAFLVIHLTGFYRETQTAGRGFIGLATTIFGNWRPVGAASGSLLFGFVDILQLRDRSAAHALLLLVALLLGALTVYYALRRSNRLAIFMAFGAAVFLNWYLFTESVPKQLPQALPYIIVLLVLLFYSTRLRMPAADGMLYRRGREE